LVFDEEVFGNKSTVLCFSANSTVNERKVYNLQQAA